MQIDAATRRNLELTQALSGGRDGSLLAAIDRTVTAGGARLLERRIVGAVARSGRRSARVWIRCGFCWNRAVCGRSARRICGGARIWTAPCRGWRWTGAGRAIWRRSGPGWRRRQRLLHGSDGDAPGAVWSRRRRRLTGHDGSGRAAGRGAGRRTAAAGARRRLHRAGLRRRSGRGAATARRGARRDCRGCRPSMSTQTGMQQPEDQAQQRAGLFHRNDGDPCREDAVAAADRDRSSTARPRPTRCGSPLCRCRRWKPGS